MKTLAAIEQAFLSALYAETEPGDLPWMRGESIPAATRFAVYRRNLLASVRGALAEAYPVVLRLVGRAFFAEAAARFARRHPSTSGDLNRFGEAFAEFLACDAPARSLAYLPDVARLEWSRHEASRAADGESFDFGALAALARERRGEVKLRLHPAVRRVRSDHPILSIWEANQPDRDGTLAGGEEGERVLVWRPDTDVRLAPLDAGEWDFLERLAEGRTLAEALDASSPLDAERLAGGRLARWVGERVIDRFSV